LAKTQDHGTDQDARLWSTLFLIMICFAANSVITRYLVLVSRVSPFLVTLIRFVSGLAVLLVLPLLFPTILHRSKPTLTSLPGAVFLGAYAFSISYGYVFISVAAGTFVFYTFVIVTMMLYSVIIEKTRFTAKMGLAQILGIAGVLVITFGRISSVTFPGIALMAITGASWGSYSAYGKRFKEAFDYTYNSFLLLGVFAAAAASAIPLTGQVVPTRISVADLGLALYMGMISTALSYVLWNRTMKKISAHIGGLVQVTVPILGATMGIILLREQLTASLIFGGALVILGIYLSQHNRPS